MKTADLLALVRQPGKCFIQVSSGDEIVWAAKWILRDWIKQTNPEHITVTTGPLGAKGHCTKTFHYNPTTK